MRRFVQLAFLLLGLTAIVSGLASVIGGVDIIPGVESADESVESEIRFFSTFWIALGCVSLWLVPRVEAETTVARAVLAALFAGGVARLIGLLSVGAPHRMFVVLMVIELVMPPIVAVAQSRIAEPIV